MSDTIENNILIKSGPVININYRPNKDEYYLIMAEACMTRATCLRRNFGAVIVRDDNIMSTGYTGAPSGEVNCCDIGVCERQRLNIPSGERYELCRSLHAEQNAIMQAGKDRCKGSTMYLVGKDVSTGLYLDAEPCMMCRRYIKESKITRLVARTADGGIRELEIK